MPLLIYVILLIISPFANSSYYVKAESLNVRESPSVNSDVVAWLKKGDAVILLSSLSTGWSNVIAVGSSATGWVSTRFIGVREKVTGIDVCDIVLNEYNRINCTEEIGFSCSDNICRLDFYVYLINTRTKKLACESIINYKTHEGFESITQSIDAPIDLSNISSKQYVSMLFYVPATNYVYVESVFCS
ncbi:SH3 domain-containing protein [Photobacterium leiognathi]|uniref:SH3 domain-containing protein n=1 Tax=Photobacterium leiognathi TaxID=553611 RepID=UPI002981EC56|nr:SH3 domain-containing protein [Photobacterium leiognathi]